MPIDASIPLQARGLKLQDPMETYGRQLSIQNALLQNQSGNMELAEKKRLGEQQAKLEAFLSNPDLDMDDPLQRRGLAAFGKTGLEYGKVWDESKKARLEQQKTMYEMMKKTAAFIYANPTMAERALTDFAARTGDDVTEELQEMSQLDEEGRRQWAMGHAADIDKMMPEFKSVDAGGSTRLGMVDPRTGDFTEKQRIDKTLAPGEAERIGLDRQRLGLEKRRVDIAEKKGDSGLTIDPITGAITASGFKTKPIPAEIAARMALAESYATQVPDILGAIGEGQTDSMANRAGIAVNVGKGAAVARRQKSGVDALIRNLTGAGMTVSEAEQYAGRYAIQATDGVETQRNKVLQLVQELRNIDSTLKTQYGQQPSGAYSGIQTPPNLSDELGGPAAPPAAPAPAFDADKEARYQQWKASQGR